MLAWDTIVLLQMGLMVWMGLLYGMACVKKDAGLVDFGWTAGLGLAAIVLAWTADGYAPRRWLVASLVALWAGRLAWHVARHRLIGHEEDGRYRRLREHWGRRAGLYFFIGFEVEAFLVTFFCIPLVVVMMNPATTFSPWELAGLAIWLLAVGGEYIADRQLEDFRNNPATKGTTCRIGLWKYSRHPNYFFEWLHWWAYVAMGITAPYGWLTLLGPVFMWVFIVYVTGIPHTERQALSSRPDYKVYQQTTNRLIPWFPKTQNS